jgi:putative salt-induced outer membrane protein
MDFDAGPAVRHTQFYAKGGEDQLAGRASVSIKWLPSKSLTVAQDAAVYVDGGDTTARSTTSVDTRLIGPLKARLSYNVQYEQDAPVGQKQVDTVSRATLVYSF